MEIGAQLEAIYHQGYCLWLGAGVTRHLSGIGSPTPGWDTLVASLETQAQLDAVPDPHDLRLSRCWWALGMPRFQESVRRHIHETLAESLLKWAEEHPASVPSQARQLVTLGRGANVVVNFNVELCTSRLIGQASGRCAIKVYESPLVTRLIGNGLWAGFHGDGAPRMSILHPHGALETGGLCVLTREDYSSMNGTLALQLAAHAAFRERLVIVGMSLSDEYLREQLTTFREQIAEIIWIKTDEDQPIPAAETWARRAGVLVLRCASWREAWEKIDGAISGERRISERQLLEAWLFAIDWACENDIQPEAAGGSRQTSHLGSLLGAARGTRGDRFSRANPRWAVTGKHVQEKLNERPPRAG